MYVSDEVVWSFRSVKRTFLRSLDELLIILDLDHIVIVWLVQAVEECKEVRLDNLIEIGLAESRQRNVKALHSK